MVIAMTSVAAAHQSSVKYAELTVDADSLAIAFRVSPADLTEPMGMRPDATPTARVAAAVPAVGRYVARWLAVSSAGAACVPDAPTTSVDADVRFVVIAWHVRCAGEIDDLVLDFTGFFAVDARHVAIVRLAAPDGDPVDVMVGAGQKIVSLHARTPASALESLRLGIEHVDTLRLHVCFVLALLLIVVIERRDGWQLRTLADAVRRAGWLVGGFTLAHLATWLAADWIVADARVVAALAALSIVYLAVEDIVTPDARWRLLAATAFGSVFGVAFAQHAPSPAYVIGVELAQLAIVLIALPLVITLARVVGAPRYRRIALPIVATIIAIIGVV
jgi:hypothetical protein